MRVAQADKSVLVLQRGKAYRPGDFPRNVEAVDEIFWRYPDRENAQGLYDVRFFSDIASVCASGVGGGSLIYANIHIRAREEIFANPRWPSIFTRERLDPYYDRVSEMLSIAAVPENFRLAKRDCFREAAEEIGHEAFDPDQAVSWTEAGGPGRDPCQLCAECEFGCQIGVKNTLDFNYLAQAEKLGAQIEPRRWVSHLSPCEEGYEVHYKNLETGESVCAVGASVVLSAGTLGTNEILLRSRDRLRTLPKLSSQLGKGFSGNGDFLGSIQNSSKNLEPWHGPDVTSVIWFFDRNPGFTMAAPTFSQPVMEVLAALGQVPGSGLMRVVSPMLWKLLPRLVPWAFAKGLLSQPRKNPGPNAGDPSRMTNLFAIGRDNGNGVIELKGNNLDIRWNYYRENRKLVDQMKAAMQEVSDLYGGTFAPLVSWNLFRRILTVHNLGGCHLSEYPATGVVSTDGEVHGYPRLFIADGSVIPSSLGIHPVMTISAVSEWIAEKVVDSFA